MLNYIKNNKVFTFLLLTMIIIIAFLTSQFFVSENNRLMNNPNTTVNNSGNTTISNFEISLNKDNLDFNWNITVGKDGLKKVEIFHDDTLVKNVSNNSTYSQNILDSNYDTGNNAFKIVATLDDKTTIEKQTYFYIDEVFNISVDTIKNKKMLTYIITYYYDVNKPVKAPKIDYLFSDTVDGSINYDHSENSNINNKYIKCSSYYVIDLSKTKPGNYKAELNWNFDEYGIEFQSSNSFNTD